MLDPLDLRGSSWTPPHHHVDLFLDYLLQVSRLQFSAGIVGVRPLLGVKPNDLCFTVVPPVQVY